MDDAVRTLKLPYTYQLVSTPVNKREARKQLGGMAVEIIEAVRDEVLEQAVRCYLSGRGLTGDRIQAIFRGEDGTIQSEVETTTRIDTSIVGGEERKSEATSPDQENGFGIVGAL